MERQELHRRIELLRAHMREGKVHFAAHLVSGFERSLDAIRLAPDGLVDEKTVDGRIRSLLTFIAYQADRDEWKDAVSLRQIQEAYFERVAHAFGQPHELLVNAKSNPYQFSDWFVSEATRAKDAVQMCDDFVTQILEFWKNISDPTWIHLEDSIDSKAVFTGELFPDGTSNIASSTGLYFDTTILPDPFVKISPLLAHMNERERVREVLRLGLQVLRYKELALADVSVPIVAILPDRHGLEEHYRNFIHHCAEENTLSHAAGLFGRPFGEVGELVNFLQSFKTSAEIVQVLKKPNELVFATEWEGTLTEHIERYLHGDGQKIKLTHPGEAVFMQLVSRFSQANDSFQRSKDLRGTPIIRAETSWLWFNWMLRNTSGKLETEELKGLHVSRSLESTVKTEISWLGNIPATALIEIRKAGALAEIRSLLGSGLGELINARPENFYRTGDKVFDNLTAAFIDHEKKLNDLCSKKWKFAGLDIGSFIVVGSIEMAAAFTGLPLFGAAAATASLTGLIPTAKELKERLTKLREESSKLNSTGVGILFKHK